MIKKSIQIAFILLVTTIDVSGQSDFAQAVQRRLSAYYENEAGPKAYVTFNQPEYHPGDTAFFKAYLLNSSGTALLKGWQVIDLYVVDHKHTVVLRNRTSIRDGSGASQLIIPRSTKEGNYTLIVAQPDLNKASRHPVAYSTSLIVTGKKLLSASPRDTASPGSSRETSIQIGQPGETNTTLTITSRKETNSLEVDVHGKNENAPALHLVCINRNKLVDALPVQFDENGRASFTLSRNGVPDGLNRFSVLDENGNVFADRWFYKRENKQVSIDTMPPYTTRSAVDFEIALPEDTPGKIVKGAISIVKNDLFPLANHAELQQALMFGDVKTEVPLSSSMPEDVINTLLATATSNPEWKSIWSASSQQQKPAYSSFFKGRIIFPDGTVAKDSSLVTFWLKNHDFVYHVYASREGRFSFPLFTEFTDDEVLYTVSHQKSHFPEARIVLDSVSIPTPDQKILRYTEKENPYAWFSALRAEVDKSYSYFQRKEDSGILRSDVESIPVDAEFPIARFKGFSSVAEMVNEVISVAKAKKIGNRYELRVFLREFAMHASANPLIMIDGVVTDSIEHLMNMDPDQIKVLGIVNSRNKLIRYGALGRNGIVTVETNRAQIRELHSQKSVFVKGIDKPHEFTPVRQKKPDDRTPSLFSVLYWDPNVTLSKTAPHEGQFFTSDDVGEYLISFSGIDENGKPVEIRKAFSVRYIAD